MFTAGALTIVVACHDNTAAIGFCFCREFCIAWCQAEVSQMRNVGTVWQQRRVGRHDVVGCNVVFQYGQYFCTECILWRNCSRNTFDVWTFHQFCFTDVILIWSNQQIIVNFKFFRNFCICKCFQTHWIGDYTSYCRSDSSFRAYQIYISRFGTAAAVEVTVKGTQRFTVITWSLAHTDTWTAAAFQNAGTCFQEDRQQTVISQTF